MLMPAGLLIVFMLAAVSVDAARSFQAKRQLVDLADSSANDAVAAAIATDRQFTVDGVIRLDAETARAIVTEAVAIRGSSDLGDVSVVSVRVEHEPGSAPVVEVVLETRIRSLFAPAVPGGAETVTLTATGRAAAVVAL